MEQFDIIGVLKTYAEGKGWKFVYGFDRFYNNAGTDEEYQPGELVLTADFKAVPMGAAGKITEITYNCLLMLGRKVEADGETTASLDETSIQKYDRRLKELCQMLATAILEVACTNELDVTNMPIEPQINVYDQNIDFAMSNVATFVQ